MNAIVAKQSP